MSKNQEFDFLSNKCSSREIRKFVSNALMNDSAIVKYPSGTRIAYKVSYICEIPAIGKVNEPSLLEEIIRRQAEELMHES